MGDLEMVSKVEYKQSFGAALKILGRVILSCQFKSGPGHQSTTPNITTFQSWRGFKPAPRIPRDHFLTQNNRDIHGQLKTSGDASMMRDLLFGHTKRAPICLLTQQQKRGAA